MSEMQNPSNEAAGIDPSKQTDPGINSQAGWTTPRDIVPHPTYWPSVMALSILGLALGFLTSILISVVGVVLFVIALSGWIGDIRNERSETH